MSLKAIKEAVELLAEDPAENIATLLAARDEIAALERAAEALISEDTESADTAVCEPAMKRYLEAMDLMDTIAKEAK